MHPIEAYLRRETGAYLDPWHDRLRSAYVDTLADLGVTKDLSDTEFLAAMERHKDVDPALTAVLAAVKATVKGGVGKLRERPQGRRYQEGSGGRPFSGRPGARTSAPPSSPGRGSTCTASCATWRR